MTQQRRKHSLLEVLLNVLIGFVVSFVANAFILPLYGMPFDWRAIWEIGLWFTLISVIRSYWVRRFFVYLHNEGILK